MAEDVGADPVAGLVDEESPGQQPHWIAAVHREENSTVVVGDVADLTAVDQLLGVLHQRRPPVVVADTGDHAGVSRRAFCGNRLRRGTADRLLAEDRLTCVCDRLDHFDVQHVGALSRRRRRRRTRPPPRASRRPRVDTRTNEPRRLVSCLDRVADHDELGLVVAIEEVARRGATATAVCLTHPAEADHTDTKRLAHRVRPSFVIGHRGSVAMSAHESGGPSDGSDRRRKPSIALPQDQRGR